MHKLFFQQSLYDRLYPLYENEVLRFWDKLQHDVAAFKSGYVFFDNPWDMECCEEVFQLSHNTYNRTPNGDPEWVFQLSRLEWLTKLVLLYQKEQSTELLKMWRSYVDSFYSNNNSIQNGLIINAARPSLLNRIINRVLRIFTSPTYPTYRTLDTAIRNYTLIVNILSCEDLLKFKDSRELLERLKSDVTFTYENLRKFDDTSNWGIIIASSYLICSLLLDENYNNLKDAAGKLVQMLKNQILPNGQHCESSFMYHNQVLLFLLRLIYWANKCRFRLPAEVYDAATRMFSFSNCICTPNCRQDTFGDSDDTSLDTILAIAHSVLKNEDFLPYVKSPDFVLLNEFDFRFSEERLSLQETKNFNKDGVTKIEYGDLVLFAYNTKFYSSHKHADNGSFTLYYRGIPVVVDSGRYTYHDKNWREYFKSAERHSCLVLGAIDVNSDLYSSKITEQKSELTCEENSALVSLSYRTEKGFVVSQIKLTSGMLEITDEITSSCDCVHQYIILHPNVEISHDCSFIIGNKYRMNIETNYNQIEIDDSWYSPHYNKKVGNKRISLLRNNNPLKTTTKLIFKNE